VKKSGMKKGKSENFPPGKRVLSRRNSRQNATNAQKAVKTGKPPGAR